MLEWRRWVVWERKIKKVKGRKMGLTKSVRVAVGGANQSRRKSEGIQREKSIKKRAQTIYAHGPFFCYDRCHLFRYAGRVARRLVTID